MSGYAVLRASEAPDYTGDAPGAFLGYARPLGAQQLAANVRVLAPGAAHVPPGTDPARGHNHRTIEEIYFVLEGEITCKLDDETVRLGPRDAILIAPATRRAVRNDGERDAAFLMLSVRVPDPRAESEWHDDFWPSPPAR